MLSALVIEGQLHHLFARRRMFRKVEAMRDHFIVCGDTAAAAYVAEELGRTQRDVVLVVPSEDALDAVGGQLGDVPGIVGDPTDDDVLISAGISHARGVVASMEGDKDNILVVLGARRLAPHARIIAATELLDTEGKLKVAGADGVVSPSKIGGMRMASELVRPTVVRFLDEMLRDKNSDLRIEEIPIPADLPNRPVSALWNPDVAGVVLLAVRHPGAGGFEFRPPNTTVLKPGMVLVVMADGEGRDRLENRIRHWHS
jgi:voltage-gated potassium channel